MLTNVDEMLKMKKEVLHSRLLSREVLMLRCSKAKAGSGVRSTLRVDDVYSATPGVAALVGHHRQC